MIDTLEVGRDIHLNASYFSSQKFKTLKINIFSRGGQPYQDKVQA